MVFAPSEIDTPLSTRPHRGTLSVRFDLIAFAVMAEIPKRNVFAFSSSNGAEVAG